METKKQSEFGMVLMVIGTIGYFACLIYSLTVTNDTSGMHSDELRDLVNQTRMVTVLTAAFMLTFMLGAILGLRESQQGINELNYNLIDEDDRKAEELAEKKTREAEEKELKELQHQRDLWRVTEEKKARKMLVEAKIRDLVDLKNEGIISEDEYQNKVNELK